MTTTGQRTRAIADTLEALTWCNTIPHTIDAIIALHAETTHGRAMPWGLTNDEILSRLVASGGSGSGGYSDPTGNAAIANAPGRDDADETLGSIDAATVLAHTSASELAHIIADCAGIQRWTPPTPASRQARIASTIAHIHNFAPHLEVACERAHPADATQIDLLLRTSLADTAIWLHRKAEAIWLESRGDRATPAVQRPLAGCTNCARFGIFSRVERYAEWCRHCGRFQADHDVLPTERICRTWDSGISRITPSMILEAKATRPAKIRRRA